MEWCLRHLHMNDPTGVTEVLGSIPNWNSANLKISSVFLFTRCQVTIIYIIHARVYLTLFHLLHEWKSHGWVCNARGTLCAKKNPVKQPSSPEVVGHWQEHLTVIKELVGLIPTWNSQIFLTLSLTHYHETIVQMYGLHLEDFMMN